MSTREVRDDQHGKLRGYTLGCRCATCREAANEYKRDYRERTEPRPDRHGQLGNYALGCRCDACFAAQQRKNREYKDAHRDELAEKARLRNMANRDHILNYLREYNATRRDPEWRRAYREANHDYFSEKDRSYRERVYGQARSAATIRPGTKWQPHEDELLARIPSNIAAASALGRTLDSVTQHRRWLRQQGLLP